jgi:hypothetical protein
MGWTPRDVCACTPFEFWAAWNGWREANSAQESQPMTRDELNDILATYDPNVEREKARLKADGKRTR